MTIEDKLTGTCPSCLEDAEFVYIGVSEMEEKIYFYNCSRCSSTISLESYYEQNPKNKNNSK